MVSAAGGSVASGAAGADPNAPYARVVIEGIDITANVRLVEVEDNDQLIDKATIELDAPAQKAAEPFQEMQSVVIELGRVSEHAVLFEGIITRVKAELADGMPRVSLRAYDLSYKMMLAPPRSKNHVGKLSAIIAGLCAQSAYGFVVGKIELSASDDEVFTADKPLRQTNMRDWEFVQLLASRYGCRAFVEYNSKSEFFFLPADRLLDGVPTISLSYDGGHGPLRSFTAERVAGMASPKRTAVVSNEAGEPQRVIRSSPSGMPATLPDVTGAAGRLLAPDDLAPDAAAMTKLQAAPQRPSELHPQQQLTGLPSSKELANKLIREDPTRSKGYVARAEAVGTINLRAKNQVRIACVPGWATADWYICQATHVYSSGAKDYSSGYFTRLVLTR